MFRKKRKRIYKRGGGLISGWAYIQNNIFVGKWVGLYPGKLKTGEGGLKWDFTVSVVSTSLQPKNCLFL